MGQAQTHLESKVFDDSAPPWDLESITANTDLSEETVNACWRMWVQHPLVQKGQLKEQAFYKVNDDRLFSHIFSFSYITLIYWNSC